MVKLPASINRLCWYKVGSLLRMTSENNTPKCGRLPSQTYRGQSLTGSGSVSALRRRQSWMEHRRHHFQFQAEPKVGNDVQSMLSGEWLHLMVRTVWKSVNENKYILHVSARRSWCMTDRRNEKFRVGDVGVTGEGISVDEWGTEWWRIFS